MSGNKNKLKLVATLAACAVLAAAQADKKAEIPPDRKAYNEAAKIEEPEKKIEALHRLRRDHPKSSYATRALYDILSTTIKSWPKDHKRVMAAAGTYVKGFAGTTRASEHTTVAGQLLDANTFLKDAEKFARKGVKDYRWGKFLDEQKKSAVAAKRKPPDEKELRGRFESSRARSLAALGRAYLMNGKYREAGKPLKEALDLNPSLWRAAAGMAEVAGKSGDEKAALDYLLQAKLAGGDEDIGRRLQAAFAKSRGGSPEELEVLLDRRYIELFPNPVHATPYKPAAKRGDRVVLAEVFTGSGCPPCVAADLAFDVVLERYERKDVAVVIYHQHIPRPDPMTNPETRARFKFAGGRGVPTYAIDGKVIPGGGGPREYTARIEKNVREAIERQLERPAGAQLSLSASKEGKAVRVTARVREVKSESKDLKLQVALVEKQIRYSGENGIRFHPMVVRSLAGFGVDPARAATVEHTFDVEKIVAALKQHLDEFEKKDERNPDGKLRFREKKHQIDDSQLAVAAFLQDEKSKEILQAAYIDLAPRVVTSTH